MRATRTRMAVAFVLLGVAVLVLKQAYHGPHADFVVSYLGNVSVSFAVYFLATVAVARMGGGRLAAVVCSLGAVEAFEVTNGFGVMLNVFDPWDLAANAVGVLLGLGIDLLILPDPQRRANAPE